MEAEYAYTGNEVPAAPAPPTFDIVAGGHGNASEPVIVPAPAPPVCHGWNSPLNREPDTPTEAHFPTAVRGSDGIHPCSNPSLYDQRGDSTMLVDELPI